jgi:uncharacterized protein (DUF2235 family)
MSDTTLRKKRLVLFFDGTGNEIQSDTNVYRLYLNLAPRNNKDGGKQLAFYCPGVGTLRGEVIRGGVFGRFTARNLRNGYQWLRQHYEDGDEVYVFGFSRGAYAAMALVGFLAWCGLLRPSAPMSIKHLFKRYKAATRPAQERGEKQDRLGQKEEEALSRDQLIEMQEAKRCLSSESKLIIEYGQKIKVKFLGVFDTVRAIGTEALFSSKFREEDEPRRGGKGPTSLVPTWIKEWWETRKYQTTVVWRYTRHVPDIVEEAYQALAIDEHRAAFAERLWIIPKGKEGDPKEPYCVKGEQRWFIGAHANVGGGYPNDVLAVIPLQWMQEKATNAGLSFKQCVPIPKDAHLGQITDSYRRFFLRTYRYWPFPQAWKWRQRGIGGDRSPERFKERIDLTALKRVLHDPNEPGYWGRIPQYHLDVARLEKMEMECTSEDEKKLVADAFEKLGGSGLNLRFNDDASR